MTAVALRPLAYARKDLPRVDGSLLIRDQWWEGVTNGYALAARQVETPSRTRFPKRWVESWGHFIRGPGPRGRPVRVGLDVLRSIVGAPVEMQVSDGTTMLATREMWFRHVLVNANLVAVTLAAVEVRKDGRVAARALRSSVPHLGPGPEVGVARTSTAPPGPSVESWGCED